MFKSPNTKKDLLEVADDLKKTLDYVTHNPPNDEVFSQIKSALELIKSSSVLSTYRSHYSIPESKIKGLMERCDYPGLGKDDRDLSRSIVVKYLTDYEQRIREEASYVS